AILEDLGPGARAALHRQAADLLTDPAAVAAHLASTEPGGDAWVAERIHEAGGAAAGAGDHGAAIGLLARALAEPPAPESRGAVLFDLGAAEARLPGHTTAVEHLREALALIEPGPARLLPALELSYAMVFAGDAAGGHAVLTDVLDSLPAELAELALLVQAASMHASFGSQEIRRRVTADGWRFTGAEDRPPSGAGDRAWLAVRSVQECLDGTATEATRLAIAAMDGGRLLAELTSDSPVWQLAGNALWWADAFEDATAAWTEALEDARRRGSRRAYGVASSAMASVTFRRGRVDQALDHAAQALDAVADDPMALWAPLAVALSVEARVARGELAEAEALLEGPHMASAGDSVILDLLLHSIALLRIAQGRPDDGLARLEECGRRQEGWGVGNPGMVPWRTTAVRALLTLGRTEEAAALAAEELAQAQAWGPARTLGMAQRSVALTLPGAEGVDGLRLSEETLAASGAALEHATTLVELGAALRRLGHRADARAPLRDGLALAREGRAHALADLAHAELEACGAAQRRLTRAGAEALTPSERRIAVMASDGMANREIAAALFVTVRTVEAHLGHAYAKLGISGRADLARALAG
ncbi:MAG: LuxR C-terminal-related transcriptional regulator, partial [Solirubrobacteraceae bacterium]